MSGEVLAEVAIQRDSSDLLAPFTVEISLRNTTKTALRIDFPTTDLDRIEILRGDRTLWSSTHGHAPLAIVRRLEITPGLSRLVSETVAGTTNDRHAFAAGRYIVRVTMLGSSLTASIEKTLDFAAPLPIAQALAKKIDTPLTISGVPSIVNGLPMLTDASGTIRLAHALGLHPSGTYVVRGSLESLGEGTTQFSIERFAPAFDESTPDPN